MHKISYTRRDLRCSYMAPRKQLIYGVVMPFVNHKTHHFQATPKIKSLSLARGNHIELKLFTIETFFC